MNPIIRQEIKNGKYTESIIGYSWESRADWPTNELYPTEDVPTGCIAPGFTLTSADVPIQYKAEQLTLDELDEANRAIARELEQDRPIQRTWN